MERPSILSIVCSLILALIPVAQTNASLVQARACIIPVETSQTCTDNSGSTGPVTATMSDSTGTEFKSSTTFATYTANYGFITGSASTNVTNTSINNAYADSLATGGWWDDWIILNPLNPALIGANGTGVANLVVSASAVVNESNSLDSGVANAFWSLDLSIGSAHLSGVEGGRDSNGVEWGSPDGTFISLPFTFVWGEPFTGPAVTFYGEAVASGRVDWTLTEIILDATMDFSSTVNWAGLSDIKDSNGNLVEFTTSSASGTDWSGSISAIPIPPAVWLFGSGLLGLIGIARRKKSS